MRVFVTGATGFIGAAVVQELLEAGHRVTGLTRNGRAAQALKAAGASSVRGGLDDLDVLQRAAGEADGVIHLGFIHDFGHLPLASRLRVIAKGLSGAGIMQGFMGEMMRTEIRALRALGAGLDGGERPPVLTVPTMGMASGRTAHEADQPDPAAPGGARSVPTEHTAAQLAGQGVRTAVVRLPPAVHDDGRAGLISELIALARKKGRSVVVGDGANRWGSVHRRDAARLYRQVLETTGANARYHAVAEEGVPMRDIAALIGRQLQVPVASVDAREAGRHLGWLGAFVAADNPACSAWTRAQLDWTPSHPSLLADLERAAFPGALQAAA